MDSCKENQSPILRPVKGSTNGNRRRLTSFIEVWQYEELEAKAKRKGLSVSNYTNTIISNFLNYEGIN